MLVLHKYIMNTTGYGCGEGLGSAAAVNSNRRHVTATGGMCPDEVKCCDVFI